MIARLDEQRAAERATRGLAVTLDKIPKHALRGIESTVDAVVELASLDFAGAKKEREAREACPDGPPSEQADQAALLATAGTEFAHVHVLAERLAHIFKPAAVQFNQELNARVFLPFNEELEALCEPPHDDGRRVGARAARALALRQEGGPRRRDRGGRGARDAAKTAKNQAAYDLAVADLAEKSAALNARLDDFESMRARASANATRARRHPRRARRRARRGGRRRPRHARAAPPPPPVAGPPAAARAPPPPAAPPAAAPPPPPPAAPAAEPSRRPSRERARPPYPESSRSLLFLLLDDGAASSSRASTLIASRFSSRSPSTAAGR